MYINAMYALGWQKVAKIREMSFRWPPKFLTSLQKRVSNLDLGQNPCDVAVANLQGFSTC